MRGFTARGARATLSQPPLASARADHERRSPPGPSAATPPATRSSPSGRRPPSPRWPGALAAPLLALFCAIGAVACGAPGEGTASGATGEPFDWPAGPHPQVEIEVAGYGTIAVELYPELAPKTVASFLELARKGFYDGTRFHRVIRDFMIQGGDPNSRDADPANDGQGGPGFTLPDEFGAAPHLRGVLSMANTGRPNSAGSQFFIVQRDHRELDGHYTIFGRVRSGLSVVDAIARTPCDDHGRWGPRNRPLEKVVIEQIRVLEKVGGGAKPEQRS